MAPTIGRKKLDFSTPAWEHLRQHFVWFFTANSSKSQNARLAQTFVHNFQAPDDLTDTTSSLMTFRNAEQYYQYQQAKFIAERGCPRMTMPDDEYAHLTAAEAPRKILGLSTIDEFKQVTHGFTLSHEDQQAWRARQKTALYIGNYYKFTDRGHPEAWWTLNSTGDRYIIKTCGQKVGGCECACGTGLKLEEALHPENRGDWRENLLGKVLMLLRGHLRKPNRPVDPTEEELEEATRAGELDDGRGCLCRDCVRYMLIDLEVSSMTRGSNGVYYL